jgi:adenosylcobinamide-phosphate synthase
MNNLSNVLSSDTLLSSVVILFAVLVLKALQSYFVTQDPMHYFRLYCQKLADKVNKTNNSARQQNISGFIAIVVTLTPMLVILWLFEAFIEVHWLWQSFLLYFALGNFGQSKVNKIVAKDLVANKNYQAKQRIAAYVLRETSELSALGISKACIESQLLRSSQLFICVSFFYLALGPLAALAFRLLLEMHYSWNIKRYKYQNFGGAVNHIVKLLQWLPSRLFALILLMGTLGQNTHLFWRLNQGKFFSFSKGNGLLIHILALGLEVKLSGVAMYNGMKLRKPSFNEQGRQPQATDIIHASKRINHALYLASLMVVMLAIITYVLNSSAR